MFIIALIQPQICYIRVKIQILLSKDVRLERVGHCFFLALTQCHQTSLGTVLYHSSSIDHYLGCISPPGEKLN